MSKHDKKGNASANDNIQVNDSSAEYVTVRIADQLFGIPVAIIQDVFQPQSVTQIPLSPKEIEGVLNLRGRVVTAIDVRCRLGLPERDDGGVSMAIGIEKDSESYGLIIDTVGEVVNLKDSEIDMNPPNLDARWREVAKGVSQLKETLLVILDVERVLDFERVVRAA